jgi:aminoglycoside phosphotransferase (APT) family kinase protein
VASGSNLDIEDPLALVKYLRGRELIELKEQPAITVLGGGVSSRVVLLERPTGESWVIKQSLSKLRVPTDWFSSPDRVHREAAALRWLGDLGIPVPRLQFEHRDTHLLVMDAVPEPHQNWKTMLLAGNLAMDQVIAFAAILGAIHTRSFARATEVSAEFDDRTFFESLRIEPYYLYTADQVPAARLFMHKVVASTRSNRHCLVHGDFSPKNVLVHDGNLVLLDHEVAHYGDPAFDVGFSMTHLLSKAHHLPEHRKRFQQAALEYWASYWQHVMGEPWAADLEARSIASTLACLLARVAGRSRLEYLSDAERNRQQQVVLGLIAEMPSEMPELISKFVRGL